MTITTLDGLIAGFKQPVPIMKTGSTMAAVGAQRMHSLWYALGNPGAATPSSDGIDGAALSGAIAGAIPRSNPVSGNAYLARLAAYASQTGSLILIDRLWQNSGLSVTSTSSQAITPATLPARDANGSTDGVGVEFALEWSAVGGAGTPNCTLTYTDQSGNTGASGIVAAVTTPPVGTFEVFSLAAGDTGVRAPTAIQLSATRTSGTMNLVGFRRIANIAMLGGSVRAVDPVTGGLPRIYDDSVLQLLWVPSGTTAVNLFGTYTEAHG